MALEVLARDIEYIDKYLNVLEDVLSLTLEELLHEEVLTSTIPKRENQVAQKPDARFGDVDGESDSIGITSQIIGKDDRSHRRLTRANSTHE